MSNSANLNLPYISPAQAQKHVTHNEALKILDALVQLSIVDNTLSAPPQTPNEGDSYTIASSPTGDWVAKENQVTIWHDGAWSFYLPNKGWITWVESNNSLQAYNGSDWVDISGVLSANTASKLGINATADTTNRLSINSGAILFNKEVDDVQVKLNKQAASDNASFLFQTNWSGRAEIGTSGDDDFHFKVSSDGATWKEGILIDASTGEVSFPNTTLGVMGPVGPKGDKGDKGEKGEKGEKGDTGATGADGETRNNIDDLVTRIFARISPTQWGFCHVVSEAFTDLAKTTKAVAADDLVAVIDDKSPNDIDLVAGGTSASTKIKLRLDPATVGVDATHLTTHFLKVTVPTGGFKGKLIMAYRSGCIVSDVDVPAGDWEVWSGHGAAIASGFIGAFAAEDISLLETEAVVEAFNKLGAGSKPIVSTNDMFRDSDAYYKSVDLRFFDFSRVTSAYSAFNGTDVEKVLFSGQDFYKLSNLSSLFLNCSSLKFVDVSNWDTSQITGTIFMFLGCTKLKRIDVSNWDTSSMTSIAHMFNGCSCLREMDISSWNTSNVTTASALFINCSSLERVRVGGAFDNTSCTNFASAFTNTALNEQAVDDILISIEKAGTSNGTLNMTGAKVSAPSSKGTTAKSALVGRGWTVTTQ